MNIAESNDGHKGLLYCGWNQGKGCFVCGTETGFRVFRTDPLKEKSRHDFMDGGIGHVEMLFRCNLLTLVGGRNDSSFPPNKVLLWDDLRKKTVSELEFTTPVKTVRLQKDRIIVVMESMVKVYSLVKDPQLLYIFETETNLEGLCVVCPNSNKSLLAFPDFKLGHVRIIDLEKTDKDSKIAAHESKLSCLAMCPEGNMLATASEKGTLIRVFDIETGTQLKELRRGMNAAKIHCINFSNDSKLLCASSDHGTVHIFAVEDQVARNTLSSLYYATSFLPKYFSSQWSFAKFQVPGNSKCICAFGNDSKSVIVLCADGNYYKFEFNCSGECQMVLSKQFLEVTEEAS